MKIAVMQPYLFPYIGYFHLVMASDVFVIYDDAQYMKQSFINRNNIIIDGEVRRFTLPVPKNSSNTLIKDLQYHASSVKLLKTISQAYAKAEFYESFFPVFKKILENKNKSINSFCMNSIVEVFKYLGISKKIILSSDLKYDRDANAECKIISICNTLKANTYINAAGGRKLYNKDMFLPHSIELKFIKTEIREYHQLSKVAFFPGLSIIDVLMNNSIPEALKMLHCFTCED